VTRYFFGTAGWSYKDWEGCVYPLRRPAAFHALVFLARFINLVEVNSTFYRMPLFRTALNWVKHVADREDFLFSVKLHGKFTHQRDAIRKDVDDFKLGIEPLRAHNRLAAILMQFPWSFVPTPSNLEYLERLFEGFSDYPMALEVRHASWDRADIFRLLKKRGVSFCNIDQPIIGKSLKPSAVSTSPATAYVRLHRRNTGNWFRKDAGRDARYDYLYADAELNEWVQRIRQLGQKSRRVIVVTNNHYRGQALANALQLQNKITGEKLDIPLDLLTSFPALKQIVQKIEKGQLDLFDGERD
jgi:uncharacterized protein YecE (DUF72 family)